MSEAKVKVILLSHTPNPEATVAMAAKLCYSPADISSLKGKIGQKTRRHLLKNWLR